jgi:hypothetical protein
MYINKKCIVLLNLFIEIHIGKVYLLVDTIHITDASVIFLIGLFPQTTCSVRLRAQNCWFTNYKGAHVIMSM